MLEARVHLIFFDELAARYLVNADLHLLPEPFVVREEPRNSFLHKLVRSPTGLGGQVVELRFLLLRQMHFHMRFTVGHVLVYVNCHGLAGRSADSARL
jgi:hypothetical protein